MSAADPAIDAVVVTPDVTIVPANIRAFYVGTGGDVVVVTSLNNTVTLTNVQSGSVIPLRITRVVAAGTTASSIVALY